MPRLFAPVVLLCWGLSGLRPAEAQVVIRERVEVRPPSADAPTASARTGSVRGYWVYYPWRSPAGSAYTVGDNAATIAGTLEVETTEGERYTADIASGFESTGESQSWAYCSPTQYYRRYHYTLDQVELLRVPIYEGESIATQTVRVGADSLVAASTQFGDVVALPADVQRLRVLRGRERGPQVDACGFPAPLGTGASHSPHDHTGGRYGVVGRADESPDDGAVRG